MKKITTIILSALSALVIGISLIDQPKENKLESLTPVSSAEHKTEGVIEPLDIEIEPVVELAPEPVAKPVAGAIVEPAPEVIQPVVEEYKAIWITGKLGDDNIEKCKAWKIDNVTGYTPEQWNELIKSEQRFTLGIYINYASRDYFCATHI